VDKEAFGRNCSGDVRSVLRNTSRDSASRHLTSPFSCAHGSWCPVGKGPASLAATPNPQLNPIPATSNARAGRYRDRIEYVPIPLAVITNRRDVPPRQVTYSAFMSLPKHSGRKGQSRIWRCVEKLLIASWGVNLVAILILSVIPISLPEGASDKVLHALAFLIASTLTLMAFRQKRSILIGLAVVVLVGVASETAQLVVPGRYASFLDLLADFVGVILGIPIGMLAAAWVSSFARRYG
jgi:VanZ family protein